MTSPIFYSLQHCPYAMRARMGLILAKQTVRLRAIVLKDKPKEMLQVSPKGTVPILVLKSRPRDDNNYRVIEESLEIMLWALKQNDPSNLLYSDQPEMLTEMLSWIKLFDSEFKTSLEKYKSAKRYHETNKVEHRQHCEKYIGQLEQKLNQHQFVMGGQLSLVDYAILPFIRQFSRVERPWYRSSPYPKLKHWLTAHLESPLFSQVMVKHPLWLENNEEVLFGARKSELLSKQ